MNIQITLVFEKKLKKKQRKNTREMEGKIFSVWDDYISKDISTECLLRKLSTV